MSPQGLLLQTDPVFFLDSFPPQVLLPELQYQLHIFFFSIFTQKDSHNNRVSSNRDNVDVGEGAVWAYGNCHLEVSAFFI